MDLVNDVVTWRELTLGSGILIALLGVLREWWFPARTVTRILADKDAQLKVITDDRDFYKAMALRLLENNRRAIDVVEKTVGSETR